MKIIFTNVEYITLYNNQNLVKVLDNYDDIVLESHINNLGNYHIGKKVNISAELNSETTMEFSGIIKEIERR